MAESTEDMAPDASPGQLQGRAGVRRVNNMPVYIVVGLVGVFLLIMALVAMDRANQQSHATVEDTNAGNAERFARMIAGQRSEGFIAAAEPPVIPELPRPNDVAKLKPPLHERPQSPEPAGQLQRPPADSSLDREAERIRKAKLKMLEQAIIARTSVKMTPQANDLAGADSGHDVQASLSAVSQRMAALGNDPVAAYQSRLAQARALSGGATGSAAASPQRSSSGNGLDGYAEFSDSGIADRWQLHSRLQAPRTPYELRAGFVIPALLISGINSDLPGQIMAQVSQDVYDTATGRYLLVPQGSRLVGSYSSRVAYGQSRVLIAWQRIVFPDGKAIDIGAMPGADNAGYAGFKDLVNNHYFRIFGTAVLMSAVVAGVSLSQTTSNSGDYSNRERAGDVLSAALGQQLGQAMAQMLMKNLNVSPTLEIRPGYRFNVIVTRDLTFRKPYEAFDY